jgi:acyl dehydratase
MAKNIKDIKVGDGYTAREEVDKYRAIYYAGASGDFNPIHIDPEFGQMVGLGGRDPAWPVHLGFAAKSITDWTGDPGGSRSSNAASPSGASGRWSSPPRPGDRRRWFGATLELKVANQDGVDVLTMVSAEIGE